MPVLVCGRCSGVVGRCLAGSRVAVVVAAVIGVVVGVAGVGVVRGLEAPVVDGRHDDHRTQYSQERVAVDDAVAEDREPDGHDDRPVGRRRQMDADRVARLDHLVGLGDADDLAVLVLAVLAVPELVEAVDLGDRVEVVLGRR